MKASRTLIQEKEVKTFIEEVKHGQEIVDEAGLSYREFCNEITWTIKKYSQPFKPELITELFEGWTRFCEGYKETFVFIGEDRESDVIDLCHTDFNLTSTIEYNYNSQRYYPFTLSDFISDCMRAGIKLTWK